MLIENSQMIVVGYVYTPTGPITQIQTFALAAGPFADLAAALVYIGSLKTASYYFLLVPADAQPPNQLYFHSVIQKPSVAIRPAERQKKRGR